MTLTATAHEKYTFSMNSLLNNDPHKYSSVLFWDNINFTHDENKILWSKSVIKL